MFHFRHILDLQDSFDYVTIVACWLDEVHWDVACWAQDYFSYVKVPMDLSTIKKKLKNRDYEDAGECIDDFNLMFDNCATFNGPMDVSPLYFTSYKDRAEYQSCYNSVAIGFILLYDCTKAL